MPRGSDLASPPALQSRQKRSGARPTADDVRNGVFWPATVDKRAKPCQADRHDRAKRLATRVARHPVQAMMEIWLYFRVDFVCAAGADRAHCFVVFLLVMDFASARHSLVVIPANPESLLSFTTGVRKCEPLLLRRDAAQAGPWRGEGGRRKSPEGARTMRASARAPGRSRMPGTAPGCAFFTVTFFQAKEMARSPAGERKLCFKRTTGARSWITRAPSLPARIRCANVRSGILPHRLTAPE